jgi:hypothetical protein
MNWIFFWIVLILIAVGLLYWACIPEPVVTGEVTDKEFRKAYSTTIYQQIGKTMVPIITHHDEKYILFVDGYTAAGTFRERAEVVVDKYTYENAEIGSTYTKGTVEVQEVQVQ